MRDYFPTAIGNGTTEAAHNSSKIRLLGKQEEASQGTHVLFTKKLRAAVMSGQVTASVRIWKTPRVTVGRYYTMEQGRIRITSIRQILWEDLTDQLARETGFRNLIDLMKTAKHGSGQNIYYVRFQYVESSQARKHR